ncbi:hypothetical protein ACFQFC_36845 [Amorphoplanes digitatis]|uniref:hypothetical protein n=1 Tax=Actinoplanes digitatis TaxID=1868 RepID=UPI003610C048
MVSDRHMPPIAIWVWSYPSRSPTLKPYPVTANWLLVVPAVIESPMNSMSLVRAGALNVAAPASRVRPWKTASPV